MTIDELFWKRGSRIISFNYSQKKNVQRKQWRDKSLPSLFLSLTFIVFHICQRTIQHIKFSRKFEIPWKFLKMIFYYIRQNPDTSLCCMYLYLDTHPHTNIYTDKEYMCLFKIFNFFSLLCILHIRENKTEFQIIPL